MRMCVCHPSWLVQSFTAPLLSVLLLLLPGSSNGGSIRVGPAPFQLAPDTPAPAEPTPTQATPRPDPCEGQPCLNGGSCLALLSAGRPEDTWEYTCTCSRGFTGRNCEASSHQLFMWGWGLIETCRNYDGKVALCVYVVIKMSSICL